MSFIDDIKNAKAASGKDGEFFEQSKDRGVATLIDASIFEGNGDKHTYKLLFNIKSGEANAPGSQRVVLKKLDTKQFEKSFAKTQIAGMVGVSKTDDDAIAKAFQSVFRLDEKGHTKAGTQSPLAGMDYNFVVGPTETRSGETQYHPSFTPVKYETTEALKAAVAENKKALGL